MKKILRSIFAVAIMLCCSKFAYAQQTQVYTVKPGDSMWKIAVKYQVGVSEIISANPKVTNPSMIYPGQKLNIPSLDAVKALENEVIRLVNVERSKAGLAPLTANWQLSRCARYKSQDMLAKNYFSHYSPTYGSPFDMMKRFGLTFHAAGENIAMGQQTPQSVMSSWMNSTGHRANILNATFKEIGVGVARGSNGKIYWTQQFMTR